MEASALFLVTVPGVPRGVSEFTASPPPGDIERVNSGGRLAAVKEEDSEDERPTTPPPSQAPSSPTTLPSSSSDSGSASTSSTERTADSVGMYVQIVYTMNMLVYFWTSESVTTMRFTTLLL
jgi:hypothetical protein